LKMVSFSADCPQDVHDNTTLRLSFAGGEAPHNHLTLDFFSQENKTNFIRHSSKVSVPIQLEEFEPIACVGRGKWGKVSVCQRRPRQEGGQSLYYAVKEVRIGNWRTARLAQQERLVMTSLKPNLFIIQLRYAIKLGSHVYFIQDFAPGGDLYTLLRNFSIKAVDVLFYAAELALALEHVHRARVVHRDIKPENLLVDQHGHIKLADFGLAKILPRGSPGTRTVCGTEGYAAPEMLRQTPLRAATCQPAPYGYSVDMWQLGVFVFELLVGHSPFYSPQSIAASKVDAPQKTPRELILAGEYLMPEHVPDSAQHFISGMLTQDPLERLGCPPGALCADQPERGWREVQGHPMFSPICWEDAAEGRLRPPVVNVGEGVDVLGNFEARFVDDDATFVGEDEWRAETPCDDSFVGFYFPGV